MKLKKALLIVDVQNDFCPGGALAVAEGDKIIPKINKYIRFFTTNKFPVFLSRDWHPKKTSHFKKFGGSWPVHCLQNTKGASFHRRLKLPSDIVILSKGMNPEEDSYSVFQSETPHGMSFLDLLNLLGIEELYIGGLATDYCVKYSVIDAAKFGFKVKLLMDAIKGVNLNPQDSEEAIKEMTKMGAKKIKLEEFSRGRKKRCR